MTFTESHTIKTLAAWIFKCLRWLFLGIGFLCRVVLIGWATLALYYSNLPWARAAAGNGGGFFGIRYLGLMGDAETTNVSPFRGSVSERACLVALHPPFA